MVTVKEIRELKQYYKDELYKQVRKEQETDLAYINDTFELPEIREPHRIYHSGMGARMVNAPAEQIITSNPQAFFEIIKGGEAPKERLGKEANGWINVLRGQNPNPFKEFVKNQLGRGEAYFKLCHNEAWVTGARNRAGLPVLFLVLDPMVVYGSPEEDENGIPLKVIVFYERQPKDVIVKYPDWKNPEGADTDRNKNAKVKWLEYWDKDVRYFEADGEAVLKGGIQENIYGFVPFIRKYSGFGRRSPTGELADLIVSDIRMSRDLIREECVTRSNRNSIEFLYAHRGKTIISPGEVDKKAFEEATWGAYSVKIFENVPQGTEIKDDEVHEVPPEMQAHLANVRAEIAQRNPFIMAGYPLGASGRQQDLSSIAAMRRYDTVIENTENATATAIEKAIEICRKVPGLKPDGLKEGDLDATFRCKVILKAKDPVEDDRKATLGSRLVAAGEIDPITNLTEFKGYTEEKAKEIMVDILKWRVLLNNPDIAELIGLRAAQKSGMLEYLQGLRQRRQQLQQQGIGEAPTQTEMGRRLGETQTETGREMGEMSLESRGARKPPQPYFRGQR